MSIRPVRNTALSIAAFALLLPLASCESKKTELAPESAPLTAPKTASVEAMPMTVVQSSGNTGFKMEAPLEVITGRAPESVSGHLTIDLKDLSKTRGLIKVDLDKLVLYQEKREKEGDQYGKEIKSDVQNEHARMWLEIGPDAPADIREKYRMAEFVLTTVKPVGAKDVTVLQGNVRKAKVDASGQFRLHGRAKEMMVQLEATFRYNGTTLQDMSVTTVKPFVVDLDTFDVRPREAFGKLAKKTLALLSPKVAKDARVSISFTAKPEAKQPGNPPKKP